MLHSAVKVTKAKIQGKGLIAQKFIPKGEVVWKLDAKEKQLTLEELKKFPPETQKLAYQYKDKFIIVSDGSEYMNHSCNANTWWSDDETLVARYDIGPGDEVTYDYATAETDECFRSKWNCRCGAKNCRKVITGKDCIDPAFQEEYEGHLPSWVVSFIEENKKLAVRCMR